MMHLEDKLASQQSLLLGVQRLQWTAGHKLCACSFFKVYCSALLHYFHYLNDYLDFSFIGLSFRLP